MSQTMGVAKRMRGYTSNTRTPHWRKIPCFLTARPPVFAAGSTGHCALERRWIERSKLVTWPTRSTNLKPLDFFWDHLKSLVYETPGTIVEDLTSRILVTSVDIACTQDLFERIRHSFVRVLLPLFVPFDITSFITTFEDY
ncbi:hypothetical protein TNCV_3521291 [Trichonephila clavipes]|nr:hypothetical protein TNCV_3521291 [Trichonephila clavipes]